MILFYLICVFYNLMQFPKYFCTALQNANQPHMREGLGPRRGSPEPSSAKCSWRVKAGASLAPCYFCCSGGCLKRRQSSIGCWHGSREGGEKDM